MPQITSNNLRIEYETFGDAGRPAMLMVMGLGAQLTLWPMQLVEALAARGFQVICYDNRDIGLSQKFGKVRAPGTMRQVLMQRLGFNVKVPYTLSDMAADGAGLLDALGIKSAHIVGASMGGMIAQHLGFSHPDKVLSLTSIMSTTGHPKLPQAQKAAIAALTKRPPLSGEAALVEHGMNIARTIGSPAYHVAEDVLRERVRRGVRRSFYPAGLPRQLAAIIADGDRRARLAGVTAPTLVIHGEDDPLIPAQGGMDTAAHIAGAELRIFPGMGHDLPAELIYPLADAIAEHASAH